MKMNWKRVAFEGDNQNPIKEIQEQDMNPAGALSMNMGAGAQENSRSKA